MSEYELIKKLKPWVSTFSEGIKMKYKHGDELCVGGKITSIFNLYENLVEKDPEAMVQVGIDDQVGEITAMLPIELYTKIKAEKGLKVDDTIIATGLVYDPYNLLPKSTRNTPTVVCWKLELLP